MNQLEINKVYKNLNTLNDAINLFDLPISTRSLSESILIMQKYESDSIDIEENYNQALAKLLKNNHIEGNDVISNSEIMTLICNNSPNLSSENIYCILNVLNHILNSIRIDK